MSPCFSPGRRRYPDPLDRRAGTGLQRRRKGSSTQDKGLPLFFDWNMMDVLEYVLGNWKKVIVSSSGLLVASGNQLLHKSLS